MWKRLVGLGGVENSDVEAVPAGPGCRPYHPPRGYGLLPSFTASPSGGINDIRSAVVAVVVVAVVVV